MSTELSSKELFIIKGNGKRELFDPRKLKDSLLQSGATVFVADDITDVISKKLKPGTTTASIYKQAFRLLRKIEKRSAVTYSLRRSIEGLGPTGFPFEIYIAQLLEKKGYKTLVGQIVQGACSEHEVDVIAWNKENCLFIEAKFHNQRGIKSDTKTALYVKARFDDLRDQEITLDGELRVMTRGLLITNTKFTENSKQYVACNGSYDMISWEHPKKGNLYDLVYETGAHPITCLPQLSDYNKQELLKRGVVHCMSIKEDPDILTEVGVNKRKSEEIMGNIDQLCSIEPHATN
jgi:hypothetical protein